MQNTDILRFGFASLSVDLNNTKILQTVRNNMHVKDDVYSE